MSETTNVAAVILARGGSKGLPKKNIRPLCGKPLIQYTINPLQQVPLIHRIIVSTDDPDIAEISRRLGAEVPFLRPAQDAGDLTSTEDSLKHALLWLKEHEGYRTDILVFLQITDLFKKPELIQKCVQSLLDDPGLDSAFVAHPTHKHYWQEREGILTRLTPPSYGPRQKKKPCYREDTGLGCATRAALVIDEGKRLGSSVKLFENDDFTVDIHDEFDLWLAEKILQERPEFSRYRL